MNGELSILREKASAWKKKEEKKKVDERFVHWLWQELRFDTDSLQTVDGQRVNVFSPGWRSWQGGPDFKQAVIRIGGGEKLKGDIEIHVHSSGWTSHGHFRDPRYNGVILHVVFRASAGRHGVHTTVDRSVPEVELSRFLEEDIDVLRHDFLTEGYPPRIPFLPGLCCSALENKADERIALLFDWAGDERVRSKAIRWEKALQADGYDEVLYRGMMEALGYKANQTPFRRVATAVPWSKLRGLDALSLQAIFLKIAGFWEDTRENIPGHDEATRIYLHQLKRSWADLAGRFGNRAVAGLKWSRIGWRPANGPPRRLAGLSHFLASQPFKGLFFPFLKDLAGLKDRGIEGKRDCLKVYRTWADCLSAPTDAYWSTHYTLGGNVLPQPFRLIGKERACAILVNVVIPLAWTFSRRAGDRKLEEVLHSVYRYAPRLADNAPSRFMLSRMFGEKTKERKALLAGARRQQGLLYLYQKYCIPQGGECDGCGLLTLAEVL